jgi:hypothetical protein
MGQDRAGFSTHNGVERLLWSGIPDVREPVDRARTRLLVRDRMVWANWQLPVRLLLFEPLKAIQSCQ